MKSKQIKTLLNLCLEKLTKNDGSEIIFYNTQDGKVELEIKLDLKEQTIWLTQNQMAELFDVSVKTVNEHLKNIY